MTISLAVCGSRDRPLLEALWIVPTMPLWFLLLRGYGLYRRPLRQFEPTHLDDASALVHALLIGSLGLWVFFRVMPDQWLNLKEVIVFGAVAGVLITTLRVAVRMVKHSIEALPRQRNRLCRQECKRMLWRQATKFETTD